MGNIVRCKLSLSASLFYYSYKKFVIAQNFLNMKQVFSYIVINNINILPISKICNFYVHKYANKYLLRMYVYISTLFSFSTRLKVRLIIVVMYYEQLI
jgi:hypothetical protein